MALLCIDIYGKEPWNISFAIFYPGALKSHFLSPPPTLIVKMFLWVLWARQRPQNPQKHLEKYELRHSRSMYGAIALWFEKP